MSNSSISSKVTHLCPHKICKTVALCTNSLALYTKFISLDISYKYPYTVSNDSLIVKRVPDTIKSPNIQLNTLGRDKIYEKGKKIV